MRRVLYVVLMPVILAACATRAARQCEPATAPLREPVVSQRALASVTASLLTALRREAPEREAQWTAHRITAYRIAVRLFCYCPAPPLAIVTVRGDSVLVRNALGQPLSEGYTEALAFTVAKLFAELRRGLTDTVWTASAEFSSTYGFPKVLRLERRDDRDGHSGYMVVVEAFEVLADTSRSSQPRRN